MLTFDSFNMQSQGICFWERASKNFQMLLLVLCGVFFSLNCN